MRAVPAERDGFARAALTAMVDSMIQGVTVTNGPIRLGGQPFQAIAHTALADRDNPYVDNTWIELRGASLA